MSRAAQSSAGFKLWHDWPTRLRLAQQASAALAFMHERNVLHRDVTSHNLLVTENWEAKVADFNLSRAIAKDSVPHSGSINSAQWAAPERLKGEVRPMLLLMKVAAPWPCAWQCHAVICEGRCMMGSEHAVQPGCGLSRCCCHAQGLELDSVF